MSSKSSFDCFFDDVVVDFEFEAPDDAVSSGTVASATISKYKSRIKQYPIDLVQLYLLLNPKYSNLFWLCWLELISFYRQQRYPRNHLSSSSSSSSVVTEENHRRKVKWIFSLLL